MKKLTCLLSACLITGCVTQTDNMSREILFKSGDKKWSDEKNSGSECYSAEVFNIEASPSEIEIHGQHELGPFGLIVTMTDNGHKTGFHGNYLVYASSTLKRQGYDLWTSFEVMNNHGSTCFLSLKIIDVLTSNVSKIEQVVPNRSPTAINRPLKPNSTQSGKFTFDDAQGACAKLGYREGTEKYADCVMQLIR